MLFLVTLHGQICFSTKPGRGQQGASRLKMIRISFENDRHHFEK
jgi:hypothetical protein